MSTPPRSSSHAALPSTLVHDLAGYGADGACRRRCLHEGCLLQLLVVEGVGLVVLVDGGQQPVAEDAGQQPGAIAALQPQLAAVYLPTALPLVLVFPLLRVTRTRLRLNVVEPDVLRAGPVRPHVLAGDRTGVAPDALVEVQDHRYLGAYLHGIGSLSESSANSLSRRCAWSIHQLRCGPLRRANRRNRPCEAR